MRTVFLHGESEGCAAATAALVERFGAPSPASDVIGELLRDKAAKDGLLTRWTEADATGFLVETAPRRLLLPDWSAVPRLLHDWFDFLAAEGLLLPGSAALPALHAAVEAAAPAYLAAMAEPAEWGPEKLLLATAREHGVDTADPGALERFAEQAADAIGRDLLAELPEPDPLPAYWLPPVRLPEQDEVTAAARRCPLVDRMARLHEWIGAGRALSELAGLPDALGTGEPAARLTLALAEHAHLVRRISGRLVRSEISSALLAEPGVLWDRLWQSFLLLDEHVGADPEEFPEVVQALLCALISDSGGVPLEQLVALTTRALAADDRADEIAAEVSAVLEHWSAMGAVQHGEPAVPQQRSSAPAGADDRAVVALTPLGRWAAHGSLRAFGFVVPAVPEVPELPAEVVVLALPGAAPDVVEEVVAGWIGRRGRAGASAELARLLRRVDDPELRLGALWLLEHTGPEGVAAVRSLSEDPVCGPAARMWLQVRPGGPEVALHRGDELAVSLDAMAVTAQEDAAAFLADFQAHPRTNQLEILGEIARTGHTRAELLLDVLAQLHPDQQVSAAARRFLADRGAAGEPAR